MRISGHPTTVKNVVQGVKVYVVKALELFKLAESPVAYQSPPPQHAERPK